MIKIGCLANFNFPYKSEIDFAKENNFDLVQIWYDKNGISLGKDENPMESIKSNNCPAIIHAVLDINEFDEHVPKLIKLLKYFKHKELIIHPVNKSEKLTSETIKKLSNKISFAYELLSKLNIDLYIENNSKLDPIFNTVDEITYIFEQNPDVKFILDIAHIESYKQLKDIVDVKLPEMLHIADKHFDIIHEHLPLGDGELDFRMIFSEILNKFDGKIILEIVQSKEAILSSRDILVKAIEMNLQ